MIKRRHLNVSIINDKTKEPSFWKWLGRSITLVTAGIACYGLFLSINSGKKMKDYFNAVDSNLTVINRAASEAEQHLKEFPSTIKTLDSAVTLMNSQIEQMSKTVTTFNQSLDGLNQVSEKQLAIIKEMNETSEKNIALLKDTQKKWEDELKKKPYLKLKFDSLLIYGLDSLSVIPKVDNTGLRGVTQFEVHLMVPKLYNFHSAGWTANDTLNFLEEWSFKIKYELYPGMEYPHKKGKFYLTIPHIGTGSMMFFAYTISYLDETRIDTISIIIPQK